MAPVEAILDRVAARADLGRRGTRPVAELALWICACVTTDDSATWLVYEQTDGRILWCRIPDGCEA